MMRTSRKRISDKGRQQSSERKAAEPDIGSYDTCAGPGSGREFLKMRQWFLVADEVR